MPSRPVTRGAAGWAAQRACVAELRAVCAIIFCSYALSLPFLTFSRVMSLFVVFLFADGALAVFCGIRAVMRHQRGLAVVLPGLPSIVASAMLLLAPAISFAALATLLGVWAAATGVLGIGAAWRDAGQGRGILLAIGAASIAWAALLCMGRAALDLPCAWWLGAYTLALGLLLLVLARLLRAEAASLY